MEYLISFILVLLEIISLDYIISAFSKNEIINRKKYTSFIVGSLIIILIINIPIFKQISFYKYILSLMLDLIIFKLIYRKKLPQLLTIIIVMSVINMSLEILFTQILFFILNVSQQEFISSVFLYIVVTLSIRALIIAIAKIFNLWYRKYYSDVEISTKENIMIALYPITTAIIILSTLIISIENNNVQLSQILMLAFMLVSNTALFYLMGYINIEKKKKQEYFILEEKIKFEKLEKKILQEYYTKQRSLSHDFNNNILIVKNLFDKLRCEDENYDIVKKYIYLLANASKSNDSVVNSNNIIINAVLNQKHQEALEKELAISYEVTDLSKINLLETDIVTILTNALDNAIQAAAESKEKNINVKITNINNEIIIQIRNSIAQKIAIIDNCIATTKNDTLDSGYGINNIKNALNKYEHKLNLASTNDEFILSILI